MKPEQIVKWANECNVPTDWRVKNLVAFAALVEAHVRADEREQCADAVMDMVRSPEYSHCWKELHEAQSKIRSRSKP